MQAKRMALALIFCLPIAVAEDPYRFFDWVVTFGDIYPLGVKQQNLRQALDAGKMLPFPDGILINGRGSNGVSFTDDRGCSYPSSGCADLLGMRCKSLL